MPAEEPLRLPVPDEAASPMHIRGLPASHSMTIRSSLPGPTTVEYATAAYEWLANPTIRDAVCTSLDQFMLQPSLSTLFTSSYNPPVASYYANYPDPSFFCPNPSEPSSSSSIRRDGTSTSSSTHRGKSSSSTRRGSLKRRSYNPYPSFSASSHSLAHPSNDDFFDNNQYSSSTTLPTTQAELAQAGPSFLVSDPSSPIPMAVSPSPDRYPSSPMMWSPSDEPLFSQDPPNDMFSFNEFAGNLDVSLGPEPSTSVALPSLPSNLPYEVHGITTSGQFMPVIVRMPSKVALDDNASILSTNTAASSSAGAPGDINAILKLVFSNSGSGFQGAEFISTKYIRRKMPVVAELGKSSRLLMQADSFKGSRWIHVGISIPNAISPLSQLTLDIFCDLQLEHLREYGEDMPIEPCKYPNGPICILIIILFTTQTTLRSRRASCLLPTWQPTNSESQWCLVTRPRFLAVSLMAGIGSDRLRVKS